MIGWSGRLDPDGNIHQFQTCKGSLNVIFYCDDGVDWLLNWVCEVSDVKERAELYRQAIDRFVGVDRSFIYLYHQNYIVAFPKNVTGYRGGPDGLIRVKGVGWN